MDFLESRYLSKLNFNDFDPKIIYHTLPTLAIMSSSMLIDWPNIKVGTKFSIKMYPLNEGHPMKIGLKNLAYRDTHPGN